jgi:NhaA family Na+:H+ antiporter
MSGPGFPSSQQQNKLATAPSRSSDSSERTQEFLSQEAKAGLLLFAAAAVALIVANSAVAPFYNRILATPIATSVGDYGLSKPLLLWINDGLMAIFFLLIGLEVKRAVIQGELSTFRTAALPAVAALGGIVCPAAIFVFVNFGIPENGRGWAIPTATDIAFALGVMSLFGPRVPTELKVFLSALAIIDDIAAIVIIAAFYSTDLSPIALGVAGVCIAVLAIANLAGVRRIDVYIAIGTVLWVSVLKSGVHATLAGVIVACAIPVAPDAHGYSPLEYLEHKLHPWVQKLILPLFAFANAGVSLAGVSLASFLSPLPLGIAAGLFVGKQLGVMAFTFAGKAAGVLDLPSNATALQFYAVAVLTGVGFTMSLFIGDLAFPGGTEISEVKLGVLLGSILSAVFGAGLLLVATRRQ